MKGQFNCSQNIFATNEKVDAHISDAVKHITPEERTAWNNKVDKVDGKGLSTNDYSDDDKEKVSKAIVLEDVEELVKPLIKKYGSSTWGSIEGDINNQTDLIDAIREMNALSSYMAFCTNANTDSLDAAFGKNNEENIKGLGKALAMYAWFKGDSKEEYPFIVLQHCNTLSEILSDSDSIAEFFNNANLCSLREASPYALSVEPNLAVKESLYDSKNQAFNNGFGNFVLSGYFPDYSSASNITFTAYDGTASPKIGGVFTINPTSSSSWRQSGAYAKSPTFKALTSILCLKDLHIKNYSQNTLSTTFVGLKLYKSDGTLVKSWGKTTTEYDVDITYDFDFVILESGESYYFEITHAANLKGSSGYQSYTEMGSVYFA